MFTDHHTTILEQLVCAPGTFTIYQDPRQDRLDRCVDSVVKRLGLANVAYRQRGFSENNFCSTAFVYARTWHLLSLSRPCALPKETRARNEFPPGQSQSSRASLKTSMSIFIQVNVFFFTRLDFFFGVVSQKVLLNFIFQ